jgi:hypothetical protein
MTKFSSFRRQNDLYIADCSLIKTRRRIQRLMKYNEQLSQIPSEFDVLDVLSEIVARKKFHKIFSSWHERQREVAQEYCKIERSRREAVPVSLNLVLNGFLKDRDIPLQDDNIESIPLSPNLPSLAEDEIEGNISIPDLSTDNETQCETATGVGTLN